MSQGKMENDTASRENLPFPHRRKIFFMASPFKQLRGAGNYQTTRRLFFIQGTFHFATWVWKVDIFLWAADTVIHVVAVGCLILAECLGELKRFQKVFKKRGKNSCALWFFNGLFCSFWENNSKRWNICKHVFSFLSIN